MKLVDFQWEAFRMQLGLKLCGLRYYHEFPKIHPDKQKKGKQSRLRVLLKCKVLTVCLDLKVILVVRPPKQ